MTKYQSLRSKEISYKLKHFSSKDLSCSLCSFYSSVLFVFFNFFKEFKEKVYAFGRCFIQSYLHCIIRSFITCGSNHNSHTILFVIGSFQWISQTASQNGSRPFLTILNHLREISVYGSERQRIVHLKYLFKKNTVSVMNKQKNMVQSPTNCIVWSVFSWGKTQCFRIA